MVIHILLCRNAICYNICIYVLIYAIYAIYVYMWIVQLTSMLRVCVVPSTQTPTVTNTFVCMRSLLTLTKQEQKHHTDTGHFLPLFLICYGCRKMLKIAKKWQRFTVIIITKSLLLSVTDGSRVLTLWLSCGFQADQRFVWNGNLLRELAAQPEVTHVTLKLWPGCFSVM